MKNISLVISDSVLDAIVLFVFIWNYTGRFIVALISAVFIFIIKLILVSIIVAFIEVSTAKLRLFKVPNLLGIAIMFGFLSLFTYYILG